MSSPPGSRAVLHGHITTQDPSRGAEPGPHTSREGTRSRCSQPQLWPAAGVCPRGPVTPAKRCTLRYLWVSLTHSKAKLQCSWFTKGCNSSCFCLTKRSNYVVQLLSLEYLFMYCIVRKPQYKQTVVALVCVVLKWQPSSHDISYLLLSSPGGRNLPRSLLGSTASSDTESGVFAVPTTLPPNSSRHNRMFSPNKEAELALKQQLDSISVRQSYGYDLLTQLLTIGVAYKFYHNIIIIK